MKIGDRISDIRGTVSRERYSPQIGVSRNTLVAYEKGATSPPAEVLTRILELHPEINPAWLLTGEGPMKGFTAQPINEGERRKIEDAQKRPPEELVVNEDTLDLINEIFIDKAGERRGEIDAAKTLLIVSTLHRFYSRNFIDSAKFRRDTMEKNIECFVRLALQDKKQ